MILKSTDFTVNYKKVLNNAYMDSFEIIDCHAHLGSYYYFHVSMNSEEDMIETMDSIGIRSACISSLMALGPDYKSGNDVIKNAVKKYPKRFIGMIVINPNYISDISTELRRCFESGYFRGIKIHPNFHNYPANGKNYIPVYEYANDRGLTILNHDWGSPKNLEDIARKYKKANFIQAHTAGWWNGIDEEPYLELAKEYRNVYLDVTASIAYYGAFEKLVECVGANKLLYGSDFTFMDAAAQIGRVILADISNDDKKKILSSNISALLNL